LRLGALAVAVVLVVEGQIILIDAAALVLAAAHMFSGYLKPAILARLYL
jgi:hypothetical protein